ncbi:alpha/beta fold hydrolase [Actinophytocola oryzae]|nr:alpha/beta fold hydrolase [Actinophytocola oryzae]
MSLVAMTATPAEPTPCLVPAADREIVFTVDGTTTYGTLHVPAHRAGHRLRAALLLPGSGPTDRDGNQPTASPNTLAQVAGALDGDRVVTLRFDKYGTGHTGLGAYRDHPAALDYPAFVRQAAAAYEVLREQPEADSHALLIVGHSEGAMTALVLGGTVHPRPAGLALLQPQAIRLLDLVALQLHAQTAEAAQQGQFTPEQQHTIDTATDAAVTALREHRPIDTTDLPPALAQLFTAFQGQSSRFVDSDDDVYPPDTAATLRPGTSVLLTCGTNDVQVPCATTDALTVALGRAHVGRPGRIPLPGVDHLLHDTNHPNTPPRPCSTPYTSSRDTETSPQPTPHKSPVDRTSRPRRPVSRLTRNLARVEILPLWQFSVW